MSSAPASKARTPTESVGNAAKVVVDRASVVYGDTTILQEISLEARSREVLCIVGASGCGKTTLLHLIAGLVPPASGSIAIDGVPVEGPGPERVMVFQDDAVFPWMKVQDNVEYGLRVKRMPRQVRERRVQEVLRLVRLEGRDDLYPRQLSGGMRKRVDLARALAVEPDVLLMDEPYAALDMMTKEELQVEFLGIQERTHTTALFVTHDLEEALYLGDRVLVMAANPGQVFAWLEIPFGHPRSIELKRSPEFQGFRGELIAKVEEAGRPRPREVSAKR
jgi:ABC-type nitrate/sulfonate/bicarbonate transport system ATPase subunit